ncbi:hypothetical protein AAVH_31392, partial [Aphelenchoides avenae]
MRDNATGYIECISSVEGNSRCDAYPRTHVNDYDDLVKALSGLQETISVAKVKEVLKFSDSIKIQEAKNFVAK